ncbi:MAG: DUF3379 family protein [Xanthomonadales bacterium]|nr:DUF3379 family protein [Xanthomonadales bacterium]
MDFSEFRRRLGAEPRSTDAELLRACNSAPEFAEAAAEAEAFETKLERALRLPEPPGLVEELCALPGRSVRPRRRWVSMALAAGLLLAVGIAGLDRLLHPRWDSVEAYVIDHYYHDGVSMLAEEPAPQDPERFRSMFARFEVEAAPALQQIVGVIKICATPDGQGLHMVLNTDVGPVTVIYMPGVPVEDREQFTFDGQRAVLVQMDLGSAAVISAAPQVAENWLAFVQETIRPLAGNS